MIDILKPGLLSTVQDAGRFGLQHVGVVPGGAMDAVAMEIANGLVGNRAGEAALEITIVGPDLIFDSEALVALCGGLGSVPGALIAAALVGLVEALTGALIGGQYVLMTQFGFIILVLLLRPRGIAGLLDHTRE